jgi:hypothetical protein
MTSPLSKTFIVEILWIVFKMSGYFQIAIFSALYILVCYNGWHGTISKPQRLCGIIVALLDIYWNILVSRSERMEYRYL